ncbi:MAG: antitoxin [bacterium]|nr:antitoxin [bacterium]
MATIQIRDVSEDAYEVIRRRARAAGMSIQGYMRGEVERLAAAPDRAELLHRVRDHVARHGVAVDTDQLLSDIAADRL